MSKKVKFKPDWKFKHGTYIFLPSIVIFPGGPGFNEFRSQEFVGIVKHYQIYNRSNVKYLCKCLKTGEFKELDKKFLEDNAKKLDIRTAILLYGRD